MQDHQPEEVQSQPYRRILVATGGAPHSEKAVERAMDLARQFGAVLDVVVVVPTQRSAMAGLAASIPGSGALEEQIVQTLYDVRAAHLRAVMARAEAAGLGSVWLKFQSQRMMQATCTAAKNWCPRFS